MPIPTVSQQLSAIRHTVAKTIMPALAADARFAQEQAGLVLASLDWAMDVVESEHRYERVEHAEHRELLRELLALAPAGEACEPLDAAAAPPDDLPALREQTRALKRCVEQTFATLTANPDSAEIRQARRLVSAVARRQTERELAWARMTGFPKGAPGIADVLAAQQPRTQL